MEPMKRVSRPLLWASLVLLLVAGCGDQAPAPAPAPTSAVVGTPFVDPAELRPLKALDREDLVIQALLDTTPAQLAAYVSPDRPARQIPADPDAALGHVFRVQGHVAQLAPSTAIHMLPKDAPDLWEVLLVVLDRDEVYSVLHVGKPDFSRYQLLSATCGVFVGLRPYVDRSGTPRQPPRLVALELTAGR